MGSIKSFPLYHSDVQKYWTL